MLVAGAGRGEAEEPERSDGNRLYGSIADKKALGIKNDANSISVLRQNAGVLSSMTCKQRIFSADKNGQT